MKRNLQKVSVRQAMIATQRRPLPGEQRVQLPASLKRKHEGEIYHLICLYSWLDSALTIITTTSHGLASTNQKPGLQLGPTLTTEVEI